MNKRTMTVKRRIFLLNTAMVLVMLLLFFVINLVVVKMYTESIEKEMVLSLENVKDTEGGLDELIEGWTIHREQFFLYFGIDGILCVGVLILVSQIFTKKLVDRIMEPLDELEQGAVRIRANDLTQEIACCGDLEFQNVCASFNDMQSHLLREQEKNEKYEKARTDMIAGISHDLKTPLTAIRGSIKGVLDGVAAEPEMQKRFLTAAYKRTGEMAGLLEQLFYLSKMETGNVPLELHRIELNAFIRNYVKNKAEFLAPEEARLEAVLPDEESWAMIDATQFQRVLDNLFGNSLKYAQVAPVHMRITLKKISAGVQIIFSDNGVGISKEKLPSVFEEFYRGDESRGKNEGNGLGRYIVKYLIQAMGGTVQAKSDNGFAVILDLPQAAGEGDN